MMSRTGRILTVVISVMIVAVVSAVALRAAQTASTSDQTVITINGLVDTPITIDLDELKSMPSVTLTSDITCVSGEWLGTHNWTGVRLNYLLNMTGIQSSAVKVAFSATDGYKTDLTMDDVKRDDVLVAYLKDGAPMPEKTKLVVPGMWGYKWISSIERIWLVDYNYMGTWEGRGYPDIVTLPSLVSPTEILF
jgi:DMSO/TMAO reductase YedYZ molybdopterin-dependent catalytic subunit